jgi:hypothetical protein
MKPKPSSPLATLKQELAFVDHAGYKKTVGTRQPLFCMESGVSWRNPMFIEDSPSCSKEKYRACNLQGDCVLLSFVPRERRQETLPCHHIPLNGKGETIATLKHDRDAVELALRNWLRKTIERLEDSKVK